MLKKRIALFLSVGIALTSFASCTKKETVETDALYPLDTDVSLTYLVSQSTSQKYFADNNGELPFSKELEKATGVDIEWIHPGDGKDLYTLIATDNLPDIISYGWNLFPGGAA